MDPTQPPAPADPAAPIAPTPAAPAAAPAVPVATQPPAPIAPRVLNPWAAVTARSAAPAAIAVAPSTEAPAPPAPAADPRIDALMAIVSEDVARDLAAVPENVRAAVRAFAGDDPIAQRNALATMRANGLTGPVTLPPGASTAVPTQQPAPASVQSPDVAALAHYDSLVAKGAHISAAAFAAGNSAAIARARAARPS